MDNLYVLFGQQSWGVAAAIVLGVSAKGYRGPSH